MGILFSCFLPHFLFLLIIAQTPSDDSAEIEPSFEVDNVDFDANNEANELSANEALLEACGEGDYERIVDALKRGAAVGAEDSDGMNALMLGTQHLM